MSRSVGDVAKKRCNTSAKRSGGYLDDDRSPSYPKAAKREKDKLSPSEDLITDNIPGPGLRGDQAAFFRIFAGRISLVSSDILSTKACKITDKDLALPPFLVKRLKRSHVKYLFPIQKELILRLGRTHNYANPLPPGDLYVCTHTGSGKTLSYAIPIMKNLCKRVNPCLRALVLAPTRGLAEQIHKVFSQLAIGSGLSVALTTGDVKDERDDCFTLLGTPTNSSLRTIDILIATPGMLVKHICHLERLSLASVEYLIIDEVDCLLDQNFNDWSRIVFKSLRQFSPERSYTSTDLSRTVLFESALQRANLSINHPIPLQKLLFSATISYNPAKMATLNLSRPAFIGETRSGSQYSTSCPNKYVLPSTISEHMVVCPKTSYKPLSLLILVTECCLSRSIVFVKSTEASNRLAKLIEIAHRLGLHSLLCDKADPSGESGGRRPIALCRAFSSDLLPEQRKRILRDFKAGCVRLLITTAVMARGIDIKNVESVINYDIPASAKTYLHRVGRTGRAGQMGSAFTIMMPSQLRWFEEEMKNIERGAPIHKISHSNFEQAIPLYSQALAELKSASCPDPSSRGDA